MNIRDWRIRKLKELTALHSKQVKCHKDFGYEDYKVKKLEELQKEFRQGWQMGTMEMEDFLLRLYVTAVSQRDDLLRDWVDDHMRRAILKQEYDTALENIQKAGVDD